MKQIRSLTVGFRTPSWFKTKAKRKNYFPKKINKKN